MSKIESRLLRDGRGGVFFDGQLLETFDTEVDSDSAAIAMARMMVVVGMAEQTGQAYKDEKPIDLFDMRIK